MSKPDSVGELITYIADNIQMESWKGYFLNLSDVYESEYDDKTMEEKYKFMKGLESLNGGMGSLNDAQHPLHVNDAIHKFYKQINMELISIWAALGNETNDLSSIKPYKVGSLVKFVPGKIRYINRDGSTKIVPDKKWVQNQQWKIEYIANPDISNMLQYSLVQGSKHALVRHDALKPVKFNLFAKLVKFFT
ncbi:hypothetical protein [Shewanella japonica]|uniref:Uncharacterized protein n=1 Tax=Shewanella japonica TaxID=93973 RepID=A0ABM6JNB0_9GAMM|nr:hypothetical protein [Shewanella japonica]ARD22786.1 hypothetical protein SJ2017_2496 [Shewanella japonica]